MLNPFYICRGGGIAYHVSVRPCEGESASVEAENNAFWMLLKVEVQILCGLCTDKHI